MTPIEKAARALCDLAVRRGIAADWTQQLGASSEARIQEMIDRDWPKWEAAARAVLLAVREPSGGMIDAALENTGIDGYVNEFWPVTPYQAMIDKILEEG